MWQMLLILFFAGIVGFLDIKYRNKIKKKYDKITYILVLSVGTLFSISYVVLDEIPTPLKIIEFIFLPISKGMNIVLNQ